MQEKVNTDEIQGRLRDLLGYKNDDAVAKALNKSRQAIYKRRYDNGGKFIRNKEELLIMVDYAIKNNTLRSTIKNIIDYIQENMYPNFSYGDHKPKTSHYLGVKITEDPIQSELGSKDFLIIIPNAHATSTRCYNHLKTLVKSLSEIEADVSILTVGEKSAESLSKTFKNAVSPVQVFYMPDDYSIPIELVISRVDKDRVWQWWSDDQFYDMAATYMPTVGNFYRSLIDQDIDPRVNSKPYKAPAVA